MKNATFALGLLCAVASVSPLAAQDLPKVSIVVFGAPSLGAFLPPVIKAQKLDEKNGLSINLRNERRTLIRPSSTPANSRLAAALRC